MLSDCSWKARISRNQGQSETMELFGLYSKCLNRPIFHPKARNNVAAVKFNQRKGDSEIWMWRLGELTPPGRQPPAFLKTCTSGEQGKKDKCSTNETTHCDYKLLHLQTRPPKKLQWSADIYRAGSVPAVCFLIIVIVHGRAHGRAHGSLRRAASPASRRQLLPDAATILTSSHLHRSA